MNTYDYSIQNLLSTIRRPKVRIHGEEERTEIQTEGIRNLFNEIIVENFQDYILIHTPVQRPLKLQIVKTRKKSPYHL
jgi:hypothetical protein